MSTNLLPPGGASDALLASEIQTISDAPLMNCLLDSIGGMLAVLDEHRQLVTVNDSLMKVLGVEDIEKVLGLRLGEAMHCIHAHEEPAGCGTTKFCSTCGAAIAMVTSLSSGKPSERLCALKVEHEGEVQELALMVKVNPMTINGQVFLILFLQDVTENQKRAALERVFLHDINNLIGALVGASEMLTTDEFSEPLVELIHKTSMRLASEVKIQQYLCKNENGFYKARYEAVTVGQIFSELDLVLKTHPGKGSKKILYSAKTPVMEVKTDVSLLIRIITNMILNGLEASKPGEEVKVWAENVDGKVAFKVWNSARIPAAIAMRVFQRNFSTKSREGRGLGTYSMKLFGEKVLGGKVDFTTSDEGTVFSLTL